jgi:hypothetical protein
VSSLTFLLLPVYLVYQGLPGFTWFTWFTRVLYLVFFLLFNGFNLLQSSTTICPPIPPYSLSRWVLLLKARPKADDAFLDVLKRFRVRSHYLIRDRLCTKSCTERQLKKMKYCIYIQYS